MSRRLKGYILILIGGLFCLTIIGIIIGLPLIIKGSHMIQEETIAKGVARALQQNKIREKEK